MKIKDVRHALVAVALALTVVSALPAWAQQFDSSQILVTKKPSASGYVRATFIDGARYVSLTDFVRLFSLNSYENLVTKKMDIKLTRVQLRLAGENPFVGVTEYSTRNQSSEQLPLPVRVVGDSLYAPLFYFLPLFNAYSQTELAIDTAREVEAASIDSARRLRKIDITGVTAESRRNGYLIRIHCTTKLTDVERFTRNDDWLYVILPNATADTTAINASDPDNIVEQVIAVQSPVSVQLAFKLKKKMETSEIIQDVSSNDILVSIHTTTPPSRKELAAEKLRKDKEARDAERTTKEAERAKKEVDQQRQVSLQAQLDTQRKKWKLDVVVLDAGHGGFDPGTLGTIGTREKDITLGIVLKLGKLIAQALPDVKIVYTRKTDRFIELYRRGQIANENGGKLFISVHCNSLERKPSSTNGFEIYLLRPGKTDDAIKIAQKENAVVRLEKDYENRYQDVTEENFILLTMAQSAYVKSSEQFASYLEEEMDKKLASESHGVKQAGFYVLVGASMPNVLVESGYLSNRKDEMFLRSPNGQQVVAESILSALKRYKATYEKTLKEGS